ncbi:hypothetical protein ACVWWO_004918 [Bradyrhizobium sp. F1.13.1]
MRTTDLTPSLIFAIGDIHGCYRKLRSLLTACHKHGADHDIRIIAMGDYVDRGPDSKEVIDFLVRNQADPNSRFICLRGNHEEMLIRAADKDRSDRDLMTWWGNGGEQTLESYGVNDPSDLPPGHLDWLRSLPLETSDRHRLFVHAGALGLASRYRINQKRTCCGYESRFSHLMRITAVSLCMVIPRPGLVNPISAPIA